MHPFFCKLHPHKSSIFPLIVISKKHTHLSHHLFCQTCHFPLLFPALLNGLEGLGCSELLGILSFVSPNLLNLQFLTNYDFQKNVLISPSLPPPMLLSIALSVLLNGLEGSGEQVRWISIFLYLRFHLFLAHLFSSVGFHFSRRPPRQDAAGRRSVMQAGPSWLAGAAFRLFHHCLPRYLTGPVGHRASRRRVSLSSLSTCVCLLPNI